MWWTVFFIIIIVIIMTILLLFQTPITEQFYNVLESNPDEIPPQQASKAQNLDNKTDINLLIDDKLKIITTPLITTFNIVVNTLNEVPNKIYDNSMKMSKTIGSKIKQYAESMATYNRTADDEENLKMIVINKRHKVFIDNLKKNKDMYQLYSNFATKFYKVSLEEQDIELLKFLIILTKYYPNITPFVSAKIQSLS